MVDDVTQEPLNYDLARSASGDDTLNLLIGEITSLKGKNAKKGEITRIKKREHACQE